MLYDRPTALLPSTSPPVPWPAPGTAEHVRSPKLRVRRASVFVHEPFEPRRREHLHVGIIADGTTRGGPHGIAEGARRVVECAERCAEREDVALLAAFILSPRNLEQRKEAFFAALHAEFLRLLEGVSSGRLLRDIRVEIHGRLDRLRREGGPAARLSHVLDLLLETTLPIQEPRLVLTFCVDYPEDTPRALDLDILVRTGMEEPSALRLSGLSVPRETACVATPVLFRDFTAAHMDQALAVLPQSSCRVAGGFASAFVTDLLDILARTTFPLPLRVHLPHGAPASEAATMLQAWTARTTSDRSTTVTAVMASGGRLHRFGPRGARVEVRLTAPGSRPWKRRNEPVAWIAPGQPSPLFHLEGTAAGDANIHPCHSTPEGIACALLQALRFQEAHPPLHGAPRPPAPPPPSVARPSPSTSPSSPAMPAPSPASSPSFRTIPGAAFAAECLAEARASGLVSGEVDWTRQALGYALTAFCIALGDAAATSPPHPEREAGARDLARVMLALASSDEEISDRIFPGERPDSRLARLAVSADLLSASVRGTPSTSPHPIREIPGATTLRAIARVWEDFFARRCGIADATLLEGVRRAAEALYDANLAELSRSDPLYTSLSRAARARAPQPLDLPTRAVVPEVVTSRIRALLEKLRRRDPLGAEARRELRLLCRLCRTAPSIGAGCALLAMAATVPASTVPPGGAAALLRTTPLIDFYFRLANDLAFTDATRGDRDRKPTTFTCLLPTGLSEKPREQAAAAALHTCRTTAAWLDSEVRASLADLETRWPLAAAWLHRGTTFGRRAYELGHYDNLSPSALSTLVAEATRPAPPHDGATLLREPSPPGRPTLPPGAPRPAPRRASPR